MGWEPPDPPKLLVSSSRVADELQIPQWKANEVCWALERVFYSPGQGHYRVTRRSLDALLGLLDRGLTLYQARSVMGRYKMRNQLPPPDIPMETVDRIAWHRKRRSYRHGPDVWWFERGE